MALCTATVCRESGEREREREGGLDPVSPVLWYPSMKRFISVRVHFQSDQDTSRSGQPEREYRRRTFLNPGHRDRDEFYQLLRPCVDQRWLFPFLFFYPSSPSLLIESRGWIARNFAVDSFEYQSLIEKPILYREFFQNSSTRRIFLQPLIYPSI